MKEVTGWGETGCFAFPAKRAIIEWKANAEQGPNCQRSHAQFPRPSHESFSAKTKQHKKSWCEHWTYKAVAVSSSHFLQVASPQDLALQMSRSLQHILLLSTLTENQTQDLPPKREIDGSTVYAEQMLKAALKISTSFNFGCCLTEHPHVCHSAACLPWRTSPQAVLNAGESWILQSKDTDKISCTSSWYQ